MTLSHTREESDTPHEPAVRPTSAGPRELRLAVVGLGMRGTLGRHVAEQHLPVRVVAVCDPVAARRAHGREQYPGAAPHADHRSLLDEGLDGVLLTTPDDTHEQLAVDFLEAGVAVFVDKPLAITTAGCDRVLETARRTGTRLYVGHNMRHMPVVRTLRELVVEGAIGEVKAVWCRHFVGHGGDFYFKDWHADRRRTTGLLLQKGAHDLDVIHWLAGGYTVRTQAMGGLTVYGDVTARGGQGARTLTDWFDPDANWPPTPTGPAAEARRGRVGRRDRPRRCGPPTPGAGGRRRATARDPPRWPGTGRRGLARGRGAGGRCRWQVPVAGVFMSCLPGIGSAGGRGPVGRAGTGRCRGVGSPR
ncbi:Gfo/Idh/MocA family oxidoreductase [Streptomyces lunalinharesii]|uniref:Oxidoreductase n=1 Tax=Streptomyces lunalinharesii TaxID=333384 RepID=A0ABP6EEI7_9ACTN